MKMNEGAKVDRPIVIAMTEKVAMSNPFFIENVRQAAEAGVKMSLVYGDDFDSEEKARAFVRTIDNDQDMKNIVFVDKRGKSYKELRAEIAQNSGLDPKDTANIGIMAGVKDNLLKENDRPENEKFLEIQEVEMNGVKVLVTINSCQILLNMVLGKELPPGVLRDEKMGIFKYLPPALPVDYGKEIETYRKAIEAIQSAA